MTCTVLDGGSVDSEGGVSVVYGGGAATDADEAIVVEKVTAEL